MTHFANSTLVTMLLLGKYYTVSVFGCRGPTVYKSRCQGHSRALEVLLFFI